MSGGATNAGVRGLLAAAAEQLAAAGVASPRHDAAELLSSVLGTTRSGLASAPGLDARRAERFATLVERRAAREPLQHLTGVAGFRHLQLAVGPGVFIPRPETEVVAGAAIAEAARVAASGRTPHVVDLCSGSGAIALSVAVEVPTAAVDAVEIDPAALSWAARNLAALAAGSTPDWGAERVRLHRVDVAEAARPGGALAPLLGAVDVVVANPPYLPDADRSALEPEVRDHDPPTAVFAGADGLSVVRTVVAVAADLLRAGGLLVCEHDARQGPGVRALLETAAWTDRRADPWTEVATRPDLTGRDRYVTARRAAAPWAAAHWAAP